MNAGDLFEEVERQLSQLTGPECEINRVERGAQVTYRLWRFTLDGWLGWSTVAQVIRIDRIVAKAGAEPVVGTRYFATSLKSDRLAKPAQWVELARLYWRCENEQHWTSDVFFGEDRKRTPWTTDPEAVLVAAFFRVIAINVLSVLRAAVRREHDRSRKLPWKDVLDRVLLVLRAHLPESRTEQMTFAVP
jgi:predicted transposase YbfD/YdcC